MRERLHRHFGQRTPKIHAAVAPMPAIPLPALPPSAAAPSGPTGGFSALVHILPPAPRGEQAGGGRLGGRGSVGIRAEAVADAADGLDVRARGPELLPQPLHV